MDDPAVAPVGVPIPKEVAIKMDRQPITSPIPAARSAPKHRPLPTAILLLLALLTAAALAAAPRTSAFAQEPIPTPPADRRADLGDAPDSTNHHGLAQEAYPGVPARFPTVWDVGGADISGPLHRNPLPIHLGYRVSGEKDADQMPDEDGVTNITDNGTDAGAMDRDEHDDGWLRMKETRFVDCQETRLRVRISNLALPSAPDGRRMFLNVWFDGNRNGQWGERKACTTPAGDNRPDAFAHEWIVQNFVVLVPGNPSVQELVVPTLKVLNEKPRATAWVRFTLSEEPIIPLAPFQHDGRGPQAPAMWQLGETEDYLYVPPLDQGEPGQIRAVKTSSADGQTVGLGDVFTYTIQIEHVGGSVPVALNMVDPLPAQVIPVGPPRVQELQPTVQTGLLQYNAAAGPSGTVLWKGSLSPNAKVAIHIPVKVRRCPPPQNPEIVNKAVVLKADATQLAQVEHRLRAREKCPGTPPEAVLEKRVIRGQEVLAPQQPGGAQPSVVEVLQGREFGYELVLRTQGLSSPQTFVITDTLPAGLGATGVQVDAGEAVLEDDGRGVRWKVRLGPDRPTARLRLRVKPTEQVPCGSPLANVAHWAAVVGDQVVARGKSNPAVIVLVCADLGDAPDSTNHPGVDMLAYPGVKATFPTVFDPATGPDQGPKHLIPWPIRLGKGVTEELDADVGPDADPTNNILPRANRADLDERDDGLVRNRLAFRNCRVATIPVAVTIDPRFLAMLPDNQEAVAYVNVWLDSNRDGAWDDTYQCPAPESSQPVTGWEHIVVDYKIDVQALGPGVHILPIPTNWPVSWPQTDEKAPAWLRITLSERPANKVLDCGAGTCYIGDGRGYSDPFRFGETEDYLYRQERPDEPPTEGMDPTVEKQGQLRLVPNPRRGSGEWRASWLVKYRNQGSATATQVVITDTLSGPQSLLRERSIPNLPHGEIDSSHVYTVGTLAPGAGGILVLETSLSLDLAPGTVITNQVTIAAAHDDDPTNNTAVVTLTVPLLPPVITYPTPSTVCTGTFTVTGRTQPGTTVELTIQDAGGTTVVTATVTPDSNGRWSYPVSGLADGEYDITAVARLGAQTSTATTVRVIVDSTLFWDPSSLRFQDEDGRVILPRDPNGRMDGTGWRVFLRRNTTYTVTVRICCSDPNAQVTLDLGDETLELTDPDGDRVYSATFTTPKTGPIQGNMRICVVCNLIKVCSDGQITIDPEGTVFDILTGQAVDAAQVACLVQEVSDAGGLPGYTLWPAGDFDQVNPQTTGDDGYFSFFTPPGTYQLQVDKEGYQPYRSPDLVVVDAPVQHDVPLTPKVVEETDVQILITDQGFEPPVVTVAPGTVIEFINVSSPLRGARSITPTAEYTGPSRLKSTDAFDSGLLASGESYKRKLTTEGTYTYVDPSRPTVSGSIIVEQTATAEQKIFLPAVSR